MKTSLSVVADTNVVIASEKSTSKSGPNREFFERWKNGEFEVLYSDDILLEYIEKMRELNISEEIIKKMLHALLKLGKQVSIIILSFALFIHLM